MMYSCCECITRLDTARAIKVEEKDEEKEEEEEEEEEEEDI